MKRPLLLLAVLALAAPASAQETYCARWIRAADKPDVQRYAMIENVKRLDGSKVDRACLVNQVDSLVRWTNRLCSGAGLSDSAFSLAFVSEARNRCP